MRSIINANTFVSLFTLKNIGISKKSAPFPGTFGGYYRLKDTSNSKSSFYTGIYTKNKRKFFIKIWKGKNLNLGRKVLKREFALNQILERCRKNSTVSLYFAKPVEICESHGVVYSVYEYLSGKTLENFASHYQVKKLLFVTGEFAKMTDHLSVNEKKYIGVRSDSYYKRALMFVGLLNLLRSPLPKMDILKIIISSQFKKVAPSKKYLLAHGDLTPSNIFISGKKTYVLDNQKILITKPFYDLYYMCINPDTESIHSKLKKSIQSHDWIFWNYIKLANAIFQV